MTELTAQQKDMLNGCLLGDGSLEKNSKNAFFSYTQKLANMKRVEEISNILSPLTGRIDFRTYNSKHSVRFRSHTNEIYTDWHSVWYPNKKKIIPSDLVFNWRILAHWIQDDGYNQVDRNRIRICSESFSIEENEFLKYCLKRDLNIEAGSEYQGKRIRIGPQYYNNVMENISSYVTTECMNYKIKKYDKAQTTD